MKRQIAGGFPRLYAAASLKRMARTAYAKLEEGFSAALCRGLIEAMRPRHRMRARLPGFPRLYAAASLKRPYAPVHIGAVRRVFRGFMPRPH